ncbi:MAG: tetratricopeptide repeat protein [Terracidiphilus sp.]
MKNPQIPPVDYTSPCNFRRRSAVWLLAIVLAPLMSVAHAQDSKARQAAPSADELRARARAAQAARNGADPEAIARANRLLLATALRESADLKVLEGQSTAALDLYQQSTALEPTSRTYLAMAYAAMRSGNLDQAVDWARQAHEIEPGNIHVDRVLAAALDQKGDYAAAVEPFARVARAEPTVDNLYPLAVCLLQTKKPADKQRAAEVFAQMRRIAGDSGSLHVLIGRAYRDGDDMPTAVREFHTALALDPRTPHAHYFLGLAQLFMNDWKPTPAIEQEFRAETALYPNDYISNYMLGIALSEDRNYDESDRYLETASRLNPSLPDAFLYMGLNAFAQEKMDRAEAMLRRAVENTGSDEARTNYQIRRAYVDLARILAQSGREDEGKTFALKARALENKVMKQTQLEVSQMMSSNGKAGGAAVVPLTHEQEEQSAPATANDDAFAAPHPTAEQLDLARQREAVLTPVIAQAFNDLGTSQAVRKNYPEALESYRQAEKWDPHLPGLAKNLGICAFRVNDFATAAQALAPVVDQGEASPALRAMLGISYFSTDHYAEAARTFAPMGDAGMTDGETGYAWAASLAHLGDMKQATGVLSAYEAQPRNDEEMLLVGQLWTEIGDFARAIATLERALDANPALKKAHFYEGLAYLRWEHWPEAAAQFQAELKIEPGDLDAEYHLGFVDLEQSRTDDALALFLNVVATNPEYVNAQYQAGKIYADRSQWQDAAPHLEVAARLSPDKDYIHYQLQSVYRQLGKTADADRELAIYKDLKKQARARIADALKQKQ